MTDQSTASREPNISLPTSKMLFAILFCSLACCLVWMLVVKLGDFDAELAEEFFRAFAMNSRITLHLNLRYGSNVHHNIEGLFKAFARALRQALSIDETTQGIPSTKATQPGNPGCCSMMKYHTLTIVHGAFRGRPYPVTSKQIYGD